MKKLYDAVRRSRRGQAPTQEPFEETKPEAKTDIGAGASFATMIGLTILILVVFFALGIWAAYLSWTSNTVVGWNTFAKVIFAIFAYFSNLSYLLGHLIYKLDLLNMIQKLSAARPAFG